MRSPEVQQLGVLSNLFRESLAMRLHESVAILGVAGGNGLEHIDSAKTRRVVGIGLNPLYLHEVRQRFPRLPGLELLCTDLAETRVNLKPVSLVHAALIFEHAGLGRCLENAVSLVAERGALSVVLQLPSEHQPEVGESPVQSIQRLASHFSLIDPEILQQKLRAHQFKLRREIQRSLPARKAFWMGAFERE